MSVLILKNTPNEGPGTIENFLVSSNIDYRIVDLSSEAILSRMILMSLLSWVVHERKRCGKISLYQQGN